MKINDKSSALNISQQDKEILGKLAKYIIYEDGIDITKVEEDVGLTEEEYIRLIEINMDYIYSSGLLQYDKL
jgi:hypothetical protein